MKTALFILAILFAGCSLFILFAWITALGLGGAINKAINKAKNEKVSHTAPPQSCR